MNEPGITCPCRTTPAGALVELSSKIHLVSSGGIAVNILQAGKIYRIDVRIAMGMEGGRKVHQQGVVGKPFIKLMFFSYIIGRC